MKLVPPDHAFYEQKSREVMGILSSYTPVLEQNSIVEAWLDMTGCEILSGQPRAAAERIMADIRDKLDLMCSIGISENKFLAKMAAEMKKPMGITELWVHDVPEKLWPLDVKAMYGIGNKTAQLLAKLNIRTIGELAKMDPAVLSEKLGKFAFEIHQKANGIDNDPVTPHSPDEMKSIGRSTTLPEDITDLEEARKVIMELAEEIAMSARRHNKKGHTVQITIKYSDFKTITRQTRVSPTNLARDIIQAGFMLLEKNWNRYRPVRLLGISISGFEEDFIDQVSFFEQADNDHDRVKEEKLERTLDQIRLKYGLDKIGRASLIKIKKDN